MKRIMTEYLMPFYRRMGLGVFFKFTGSIMDLFIPYILAYIIDSVIPLNDKTQIYYWGGVMVISAIIGKINVDEQSELAAEFKVMTIPTLAVLKGGVVVKR